ncbi:MAG: M23 family metallopeptidase [Syntrophomonadaceae bacterium]|mgnify:CR=1 FL=1|nr:M23 family metallopeptidase [Syntrophomonadaceae bacterium]
MKHRRNVILLFTAVFLITVSALSLHLGPRLGKAQHTTAYRVLLDGKTWFYIHDRALVEELLEEYKNEYLSKIDGDAAIKSARFKQKIDIVEVNNYSGKLYSEREAWEEIHSCEEEATRFEVREGDNLWTIGRDYNLTVDEILALNPGLNEDSVIYPGDRITVKAENPRLDVVVVYEITVVEDVPYDTVIIYDSAMYESQRLVESQGVPGKEKKRYEITLENNIEIDRKTLESTVISEPVPAKVRVGTKKTVSRSGSNFGIVRGGRLTSNFGTRVHPVTGKSKFHKGIDVAAPHGSPVYAYSSGTVIYSGYMSGYGNLIAISHGNGMVTRYGHLSARYVKVGQKVSTGQKIGAVGSTGVSTGPHLHFEVLINGSFKNPLKYL